jgi:hypothetical protein
MHLLNNEVISQWRDVKFYVSTDADTIFRLRGNQPSYYATFTEIL